MSFRKPTEEVKTKLMEIINSLCTKTDLLKALNGFTIHKWVDDNEDILREYKILFCHGATKGVFVFEDEEISNWVIKMDIDECSYCETEEEVFRKAVDNNLQDYFAPMFILGNIEDRTFYIQEKEKPVEFCSTEEAACFYDLVNELDYDFDDLNTSERVNLLFEYDDLKDDLDEFLCVNNVNDLHEGNWGITEDGRIVMIDYSGF